MKADDLRDRKDFLLMQQSLLSDRLEKYMEETEPTVREIAAASREFSAEICGLESYFLYRCNTFQTHCTELVESLANNIILSKTRIDYNFFTNLLRVDYAFHVLGNRIEPGGFKINALVDINTGRIYFNKERNSSRLTETVPGKTKHTEACAGSATMPPRGSEMEDALDKPHQGTQPAPGAPGSPVHAMPGHRARQITAGKLMDNKGLARRKGIAKLADSNRTGADDASLLGPNNAGASAPGALPLSKADSGSVPPSAAYDSISSLYRHNFPSMNFLTTDIPVCGFPHLQALFRKPFSINLSIVEMNRYITEKKVAVIFNRMRAMKDMELEGLLYLTSLEYYKKYMYSELLPTTELNEPWFEREIESFLSDVPIPKKAPLLNLLLNIAPGLLYSVDWPKYSGLPRAYLLTWIIQYQQE